MRAVDRVNTLTMELYALYVRRYTSNGDVTLDVKLLLITIDKDNKLC